MMILHRLFPLLALLPFFFIAASSATTKEFPRPLSERDADLYEQIFALQDDGEIKEAAKLIKQLDSQLLMGHVLAQKYLHPTAWRSSYTELAQWLDKYNDLPTASRIKWLSDKRRPKGAKA
ncbi:MAG: lytic transglycosylase domain-containing protein, partial [Pseudomonadota bacterium]|nr:lytic transglycosylase domain-containing protein [Pseudomonadota bacterium]